MVILQESHERRPDLDSNSDFDRFFRSLPVPDNTIRFFNHVDFFSVHGNDARLAAIELYETNNVLGNQSNMPSLTMTKLAFQKFLQICLCEKGRSIEIWQGNRSAGWHIVQKASPGNVQAVSSWLLSTNHENYTLLALHVTKTSGSTNLNCCFADLERSELGLMSVIEDATFSNLETILIQLDVKECLLSDAIKNGQEMQTLTAIFQRCNVVQTFCDASYFSDSRPCKEFDQLFSPPLAADILERESSSLCAASALMTYTKVSASHHSGKFVYWTFDQSAYMKLDGSAMKALSLNPTVKEHSGRSLNLFTLLNRCRTPLGSRLLALWLKQPLLDIKAISNRHAILQCFLEQIDLRERLQSELKLIPDLVRLNSRLRSGHATLEDVVRAYQVCSRVPELVSALQHTNMTAQEQICISAAYLTQLQESEPPLHKFMDLVESTVDLVALDRHEYLIRADFDNNLSILRQKINDHRDKIDAEHHRVATELNLEVDKKLKLENHSSFGYCLRLSRAEASVIRNKSKYKELQTAKAGVYFTTSDLIGFAKTYSEVNTQYTRHQSGLVREVVSIAASYCPVFDTLGKVIAHLDVMLSFAQVSASAPIAYVRPHMHRIGTGDTILQAARHPCMEAQDDIQFIPNDVSLKRDKSEFLIITGANMGGKSTYIRQVGVIILLAQIGCFVPCDSAEISICDSILARVGAGDSQLKGISTFMSECLETNSILRTARKSSLIIIDELGRGTSTTDGFGLAYAISEHIIKQIGCFTLFATHFHELTSLEGKFVTVKNLHVATHLEETSAGPSITLLHKIVPGSCNQSFGIHVAELARFPDALVRMSKRKLEDLEQSSHIVQDVESRKTDQFQNYESISDILGKLPSDSRKAAEIFQSLLRTRS